MPVYDYKCPGHGLFHELATMADSAKPAPCPKCGVQSPRVVMIPPAILNMAQGKKAAQAKNEESRHSPIISTRDSRREAAEREQHRHKHKGSCGCSSEVNKSSLKQQVVYLADGSKVFPSQRPWMISH